MLMFSQTMAVRTTRGYILLHIDVKIFFGGTIFSTPRLLIVVAPPSIGDFGDICLSLDLSITILIFSSVEYFFCGSVA